jgi:hypothetical protein
MASHVMNERLNANTRLIVARRDNTESVSSTANLAEIISGSAEAGPINGSETILVVQTDAAGHDVGVAMALADISGSGDPVPADQVTLAPPVAGAANVQAGLEAMLPLSGGTLRGALVLAGNPTTGQQAASKAYVDDAIAAAAPTGFLPLSGGTMTGALLLDDNPDASMQAATKQYVAGLVAALEQRVQALENQVAAPPARTTP